MSLSWKTEIKGDEVVASGVCEATGSPYEVRAPLDRYLAWKNGAKIQDALPGLSADDREFLMSGTTPAEWDAAFSS